MVHSLGYRIHSKINRWLHGGRRARQRKRVRLAAEYLRGEGIEIGALWCPLALPETARVRYVDRMSVPNLRHQHEELATRDLVEVDIIDDGETLHSLADASEDFVIANHVLEHCEDPIGTLGNWLRVLRPGGRVFLAVPDKRFTFDHPRPVTPVEHFRRDWEDGPEWSRAGHYQEWVTVVEGRSGGDAVRQARKLADEEYSIHFHTWTPRSMQRFLAESGRALEGAFRTLVFVRNGREMVAILERT